MNYHQYYPVDVVNGPVTRCTLFVAGCLHQCKSCYNKSTWKIDSGKPFTQAMKNQIISDLQDQRIVRQGLSLSMGVIHYIHKMCRWFLQLIKRVKLECPDKDIWLWTGYTLDELTDQQCEVVNYLNVLVDGKFIKALYEPNSL